MIQLWEYVKEEVRNNLLFWTLLSMLVIIWAMGGL